MSEVLYTKSLSQLLIEAASNARHIDEILKDIDVKVDDKYIEKVKENLGESLATRYIDYTRIKEMANRAREHRLIPEYTESFFHKAFLKAGGRLKERKLPFIGIDSVPYEIRRISDEIDFKKSHGELLKRYPKITFDKEVAFKNQDAEFVSFGHPLFEATLSWIEKNYSHCLTNGAVFTDPDGKLNGNILFYEGEVKDGTGAIAGMRLFAFYMDQVNMRPVSPAIVWDFAEGGKLTPRDINVEEIKKRVSPIAINKLKDYREEILKERIRQAEIKEKYGIKSLEYFIVKLDGELIELKDRKEQGELVDLPIRNKEERKESYERALIELKKQIEREKNLTMSMPRFLGMIRVTPLEKPDASMRSNEEIEQIGMNTATEYEIKNGRNPIDVSSENLGFDIRSTDKSEMPRYIEVKARAAKGAVSLTQNEWFKAKRFKDDYYLYVVLNASSHPELYIIPNPAENLIPEERVEIVRYVLSFDEFTRKGIRIDTI
ncbi:MAG: DUF3883 domain-containing protein [Deltaproteobacteria bacterium]|nr:DUF3883 domain-containing protein [Deltaproteobacteria bacterium]